MDSNKKEDPDITQTASEGEEMENLMDSWPTPGQRVNEDIGTHGTQVETQDDVELELAASSHVDSRLYASSSHENPSDFSSGPGGVKRNNNDLLSSTDEESDSNVIRLGVGSVVNSLFNKARKKLKDVNLS